MNLDSMERGALRAHVDQLLEEAWDSMNRHMEKAAGLMEEAFRLGRPVWDDSLELHRLAWLAESNLQRGHLPAALAAAEEAEAYRHLAVFPRLNRVVLSNAGRAQALMGRYSEALVCFQELYLICQREGNRAGEASNLNNMALVCCQTGDLDTAHRLFQQALDMHKERDDLRGQCFVHNNRAMFPRPGEEEQALEWARLALELARQAGSVQLELMALDTLGGLLVRLDRWAEARPLLEETVAKARELHDLRNLAPAWLNLARTLLAAGETSAALAELEAAQTMLDEQNMGAERVACHELRARALEERGRVPEALEQLKLHLELKESILGATEQQRVKNLQILHETAADRRALAEQARRANEMEALAAVGREITASLEPGTVLERIAQRAKELLRASDCAIFLKQPDGRHVKARVVLGEHVQLVLDKLLPVDGSLAGAICQSGGADRVNHPELDSRVLNLPEEEGSTTFRPADYPIAGAALSHPEGSLGSLMVWRQRSESGEFDSQDLDFLAALAQQAAVAIHNARLFEELARAKAAAEEALAQVKTLKGLVPICAHCKNIRDDEGFWHNVADYMRDHTEAEFSHGLCPQCIRQLYPEMTQPE
jgi:tetratricopeptide (TPR) repeat protein